MENRGLLFIPDISGFTRFVNAMEIDHSRLVIQELLEVLINANKIGLEISEIEGDAILFYKFGESPEPKELYRQVEEMFCEFHKHLISYDQCRYCQCPACSSAIDLTLKVITHYGEFTGYNVRNFNKLIGKDIIVAHQLLKNDIEQHEYWLVTKNLVDDPPHDLAGWMQWNSSAKQTEIGEVPFFYTQLSELKNQISAPPLPQSNLSDKLKMVSVSREYETDIITLFHASGDMGLRHRWQEGVKAIEGIDHVLPRVGMCCCCVTDHGKEMICSCGYSFATERIEFTEMDENKKTVTNFLLEKMSENKIRLTIDFYVPKELIEVFEATEKIQTESQLERSLINLDPLLKEINITEDEHSRHANHN